MINTSVTVTRSGPGTVAIQKAIDKLRKAEVLIGIPSSSAPRKGRINNAQLLWLLEKGSPLRKMPARPVLRPAIASVQDLISAELLQSARAIFGGNPQLARTHLEKAGIIGANAAKRRFGSSALAPNAPSTIRRKKSDKPLIDLGILRRAVTSVVREG
jgi:hypothetical protein